MIIDSKNIEFGYELISVIPYANWLNEHGMLDGTISGNDTECLYFFSKEHKINPELRSWYNTELVDYPNIRIHRHTLDKRMFLPPDYKKHFANDRFRFDKEIVIICNRHNIEWEKKPINYFDLDTLKILFEMLQDKYQVVYINIEGRPELYDNAPPEPFGDKELLLHYPKVINIHDLHFDNQDLSFNTLQLMLFANCEKYITLNGGHALLAAYFGGENFIMSKYGNPQAKEISEAVNSYYRWYRDFGGQRCIHVSTEMQLIERVKDSWIDCNPIVSILVRTSNRPNFFKNCMKSIRNQDYKNIDIWVSIDEKDNDYTIKYPVYPVFVDRKQSYKPPSNDVSYGRVMTYNLYLNELQRHVKSGLILYLDDDDQYNEKESISKIVAEYKNGNELVYWRVKIGHKIIPENMYFGKKPEVFQISGIGFAFDSKYTDLAQWEPFKRGDFRVALKLDTIITNKAYINEVLSSSQNGSHMGLNIDLSSDELKKIEMEKTICVKIIKDKYKGQQLPFKTGDTIEVTESKARQYFIHGIAIPYHKDIVEQGLVEALVEEKPTKEPIKA